MCDPCCGPFECSPKCYNSAQLEALPQCAPRIPPPFPKCITVQQPPRLICKKRVVFTEKIVPEPMVVNRCRQITIPKVVDTTRVIKVPKLVWVSQMVREPRVIYYPSMIPDPYVVCYPKRICEPREVCQSILCQPKPQTIDIPPPREYCCYPNGPVNYKPSAACPPCPIGPCAPNGACCPLPCFSTNQYPPCEQHDNALALIRDQSRTSRRCNHVARLDLQLLALSVGTPRGSRSRELRCGILYTTCDCIKRNGLQDKCPRAACQGRPACMCFPFPTCGPASFPLRFANMTMGVNNKRMRCAATAASSAGGGGLPRACGGCCNGGGGCPPCGGCGPCGPCGGGCSDCPCCGPHSPPCGAPAPIPCSPAPGCCCPPLPEGGIPDPRVWNCCNTPPTYPSICPARYLKRKDNQPCVWCAPCKAHCYNTPPKCCC